MDLLTMWLTGSVLKWASAGRAREPTALSDDALLTDRDGQPIPYWGEDEDGNTLYPGPS